MKYQDFSFIFIACREDTEDVVVAMVTNVLSQLQESFPLWRVAGSFEISFTKYGNLISIRSPLPGA